MRKLLINFIVKVSVSDMFVAPLTLIVSGPNMLVPLLCVVQYNIWHMLLSMVNLQWILRRQRKLRVDVYKINI